MGSFFGFIIMLFCICYFMKEKRIGYGGVNVKWEESPVLFIFFLVLYIVFFMVLFVWMLQDMNIISRSYPIK